ncbi:MAG: hypothetical protein AB9919_02170 [Geobacteraceae bacterium]
MLKDNNVEGMKINIREFGQEKQLVKIVVEVKVHCREPYQVSHIMRRKEVTEEKLLELIDIAQKAA